MIKRFLLIPLFLLPSLLMAQEEEPTDVQLGGEKFSRLLEVVDEQYVDSVNAEELVEIAIRNMLEDLDPHSIYLSKKELEKANEPLIGNFEGIGVQFNILNDTILVVSPISGGPSEKLGIQSGDKIIKIEKELVAGIGFTNKDVVDRLRGPKGSKVNISVKRKGEKKLIKYTIERDKIPLFSVDASFMAAPETGYIKLNRFSATTMSEMAKAFKELQEEGMENLILDLRDNSGGYLNTAIRLADEFLEDGKMIVYTEGRSSPRREREATSRGRFEKGKLVVLINEGSASASEIVSGAIQDWDRGLVIGRRSFGKGLVQKPYKLPDGSAVRLTISRYYTPTGRSIQRPYEEGSKAYRKEVRDRMSKGELTNMDSIDLPDSLKFYTPNKRIVYGGGGILPDIFVPIDTFGVSDYYLNVRREGVLNQYSLKYVDANRTKLYNEYKNPASFRENFDASGDFFNEFLAFAEEKGIEKSDEDLEKSRALIETQLKALVARGLWKSSAYYEVYNYVDPTFLKALESIKDDTFENLNLSYN